MQVQTCFDELDFGSNLGVRYRYYTPGYYAIINYLLL